MTAEQDRAAAVIAARTSRGWSQRDLAERATVAPNTVNNLEAGRPVHPRTWAAIRAALDLPLALDAAPAPDPEHPADVELVATVVRQWITAIPAGEPRAAATLALFRHLTGTAP